VKIALQAVRRATERALLTAGSSIPSSNAMTLITVSSSISVKPFCLDILLYQLGLINALSI